MLFPLCGNSVLTVLGTALTLWLQLKEDLRKMSIGCPVQDYISQRPLCSVEAMRLVLSSGLRANVIVGSLGPKLDLKKNFFFNPALLRYN